MGNSIKYTTGSESNSLAKGNFRIGTGDVGKGASSVTGFYKATEPPSGGYRVYLYNDGLSGDIAYYTATNDSELISFTNNLVGTSYTTVQECLVYYDSQTDKVCFNREYEPIVTNGLVFNVDAGFVPSYPKFNTFLGDVSNNDYYEYDVKNICRPLNNWEVIRSNIQLITDGSIPPPFPNAQVWSSTINTSQFANTLHRVWGNGNVNGAIGTLGQGFYRYYMWVRGISTNTSGCTIAIDISDGPPPGIQTKVIGQNEEWQLLSAWDNGGAGYNASKFFDFFLTGVNGDTYYISSMVIARFDAPTAETLVKLYPFPSYINYSGTTSVNLQGVFNNGTTYNSNYGGSILLDGVDDNVDCSTLPTQFFLGTSPYTIEVWANQLSRQSSFRMPVSSENSIVIGRDGVCLTISSANTTNVSVIHERFGSNTQVSSSLSVPYQLIVNTPFHMVATYDGQKVKVYLNGSGSGESAANTNITNTTTSLRLGSRGSGSGNFFNGEIYTNRVYNRSLSSSEVLQNYQAMLPRFLNANIVMSGLVFYVDAGYNSSYFGSGTTWYDVSGNGYNGTLTNGPTYSTDGGGSIVFDGVDDYVNNIGGTSTFSFIQNTGVFTISAWVRLTDLSVPRYFLGNNDGTTSAKGFYLGYTGASGRIWMAITYGVGGQLTISLIRNNFFTDDSWVFVTCVGNGTTCQFYRNGQIFESSGTFGTLSTGDSTRVLSVGRINNVNGLYWKGNVAQTSIYNRALTSAEVLQNYNAQKARFGL